MKSKEYNKLRKDLIEKAFGIADEKGQDYRVGNPDVLHNFRSVGESLGIDPMIVLGIYMKKHLDAISNYIKTGGQSESEPIEFRIIDAIVYLVLLWAMINDRRNGSEDVPEWVVGLSREVPKTLEPHIKKDLLELIESLPDASPKDAKFLLQVALEDVQNSVDRNDPIRSPSTFAEAFDE